MAQNTQITASLDWVEVTDADIQSITIQNKGGNGLEITATSGDAPDIDAGSISLDAGQIIINEFLSDLFAGVAGPVRVFVRGNGPVFVSHA